jgi:hypothetical protein
MNKTTNGRVDIKTPNTSKLFQMYDKIPAHQCTSYRNPTEGLWDETTLSNLFFSRQNIKIIQNGIRAGVYKKSRGQHVIGEQDCDSLKIIMRSVYLQNSANQPTNITQQIEALKQMVLDYSIQQVYSEVQGYVKYISDVSTLAVPIAHPITTNNTDRQLLLKPWF